MWGQRWDSTEGMGAVRKTATVNKQSQEGYNVFLWLHSELIWISLVDMISGPKNIGAQHWW